VLTSTSLKFTSGLHNSGPALRVRYCPMKRISQVDGRAFLFLRASAARPIVKTSKTKEVSELNPERENGAGAGATIMRRECRSAGAALCRHAGVRQQSLLADVSLDQARRAGALSLLAAGDRQSHRSKRSRRVARLARHRDSHWRQRRWFAPVCDIGVLAQARRRSGAGRARFAGANDRL
jgi:hypothetical protein